MKINLKLLHTFMLVSEHASFRLAADEVNRSPSAVSMQIRELEQQLGTALFQRTTRKVVLTADGERLFARVKDAMLSVQVAVDELLESVKQREGLVRLGCAPSVAAAYLSDILADFRALHPTATLRVRELVSPDLLAAVSHQEVDFGVSPRVASMAEFHFEPIFREPICAVVPAGLGYDDRSDITAAAVATMPLISLLHMPVIRVDEAGEEETAIEDVLSGLAPTLNILYVVQQAHTALCMTASGLGVCIVPRITLVDRDLSRVRVLPIVKPTLVRDVGIVKLKGQVLPRLPERLVDLLKMRLSRVQGCDARI